MADLDDIKSIASSISKKLGILASNTYEITDLKDKITILTEQHTSLINELKEIREALYEISQSFKLIGVRGLPFYEREYEFIVNKLKSKTWPLTKFRLAVSDSYLPFFNKLIFPHLTNKDNKLLIVSKYPIDPNCYKEFINVEFYLTKDIDNIKSNQTFDVIAIYDVLDRVQDPIVLLSNLRCLCTNDTLVTIRFRPWTSPCGGDCMYQFLHLIFDDIELARYHGLSNSCQSRINNPLETYDHWINESGFSMMDRTIERSSFDPFFLEPILKKRIIRNCNGIFNQESLEIEYVDVIIKKAETII